MTSQQKRKYLHQIGKAESALEDLREALEEVQNVFDNNSTSTPIDIQKKLLVLTPLPKSFQRDIKKGINKIEFSVYDVIFRVEESIEWLAEENDHTRHQ